MTKAPRPVGADFEHRVLRAFESRGRYLLIGEVSLETGYRLETVEYHLEDLVSRGALRHMTPAERKAVGLHPLTVGFILVDPSKFTTK